MKNLINRTGVFLFITALMISGNSMAQSVGIGTISPLPSAILQLDASNQAFLPPRMNTQQMNAIPNPAFGMVVYNTQTQQPFVYSRYRATSNPLLFPQNRWEPISTGPRMLAWGYIDSTSGATINGSGNFTVSWDAAAGNNLSNFYRLRLSGDVAFKRDSMLLMVTAVGSGSWDQAISVSESLAAGQSVPDAAIKFTDISRKIAGLPIENQRRKSHFYFTLYDMRRQPW